MLVPVTLSWIAVGMTEATVPSTQDRMMPTPNPSCRRKAPTGRTAIFTMEKVRLRLSCRPPRSRPIVASSNTSVAPVSATPRAKISIRKGVPLISTNRLLKCGAMTQKAIPRISEPTKETISAEATRPPRDRRCGSSPISTVPRPNMPTVPSSVMAEMPADP
jgi:hypothetical protein